MHAHWMESAEKKKSTNRTCRQSLSCARADIHICTHTHGPQINSHPIDRFTVLNIFSWLRGGLACAFVCKRSVKTHSTRKWNENLYLFLGFLDICLQYGNSDRSSCWMNHDNINGIIVLRVSRSNLCSYQCEWWSPAIKETCENTVNFYIINNQEWPMGIWATECKKQIETTWSAYVDYICRNNVSDEHCFRKSFVNEWGKFAKNT